MACIAGVATLSLFFSPGLGRESPYDAAQLRRYHVFVNLFIFAMLLAVSANNVGIMWIAVEATTIFSACCGTSLGRQVSRCRSRYSYRA